jgi:hypothetical protein
MSWRDASSSDEDLLLQFAAEALRSAAPSLEEVVASGRMAWDLHRVTGESPTATRHPGRRRNPSTICSGPR